MAKRTFLIFSPSHILECIVTVNTTPSACVMSIQADKRNSWRKFEYTNTIKFKRREGDIDDNDDTLEWHTMYRLLTVCNPVAVNLTYLNRHGMTPGVVWHANLGSGYCREVSI